MIKETKIFVNKRFYIIFCLIKIIPWYLKNYDFEVVKCSMLFGKVWLRQPIKSLINAKMKNKCKCHIKFFLSTFNTHSTLIIRSFQITAVNACLCRISFFFIMSYEASHISTWSSSYLFQLVLMSNITPNETYFECRWKFDLIKVYCPFFKLKRNSFPHFIYYL